MKRYIRSSIGTYRGYDIEIEKSGNQRYYFVDDERNLHFADLEEELKAQIDEYLRNKGVSPVRSSTYVQKLIRKRPKKDRNGEPLVYSGSGGRSLVGINYKSIDKFETKEEAEENLKKYAKNPEEWEVVEIDLSDNIETSQSISGWYVGEPDPTGQLEGDARFMNRMKSWNDVYREFCKIADKYFPDDNKIVLEVEEFYDRYRKYKNSPNWKYFEEAYRRWNESFDTESYEESFIPAEGVESASILANEGNLKPFLVTFGYEDGDAENGPIFHGGEDLVYAENEEDACRRWEEYCDVEFQDNYAGCNARPATEEEIQKINEEKESYGILPPDNIKSSNDINRKLINDDLTNFLEDLKYMHGVLLDKNCAFLMLLDEEEKRLERWMTKYMIAADDGRESACEEIARIVEEYVEPLPVLID